MIRVTTLTRALLTVTAIGLLLGGLSLLVLPDYDTAGPSLDVVFRIAARTGADPRTLWGLAFLAVAAIAAVGARSRRYERVALLTVLGAEAGWALGLTAPLVLGHRANALIVIAWLMLAATTGVVVTYNRHR